MLEHVALHMSMQRTLCSAVALSQGQAAGQAGHSHALAPDADAGAAEEAPRLDAAAQQPVHRRASGAGQAAAAGAEVGPGSEWCLVLLCLAATQQVRPMLTRQQDAATHKPCGRRVHSSSWGTVQATQICEAV